MLLIDFLDEDAHLRRKTIGGLVNRANALKPKFFVYNGTKQSYMDGLKRTATPRQFRSFKNSLKKQQKDYRKSLAALSPEEREMQRNNSEMTSDLLYKGMGAAYQPTSRTIGINRGLLKSGLMKRIPGKKFTLRPLIRHELQHYKQDMEARKIGGATASNQLFSNYGKSANKPGGYIVSPLEYDANLAGLKPSHTGKTLTKQAVLTTMQPKKFKLDHPVTFANGKRANQMIFKKSGIKELEPDEMLGFLTKNYPKVFSQ